MTTIVYDHVKRQIAVDGLTTSDDIVISASVKKWIERGDGSIWFLCGALSDFPAFVECVESGKKAEFDLNCNAFFVRDGKVFIAGLDNKEPWSHEITCSRAIGTGFKFAMSALDFGKSAHEAVTYAATRDIYTGGVIRVYDIVKGEFI